MKGIVVEGTNEKPLLVWRDVADVDYAADEVFTGLISCKPEVVIHRRRGPVRFWGWRWPV